MFIRLKKLLNKRILRLGNKEKIELGFIQKKWLIIIKSLLEKNERPKNLFFELKPSTPIRLDNGVLSIEVKNQAISSELSLMGYELMDEINQTLGQRVVRKLFFKLKRSK